MPQNAFKVYNASAGAGKTYSLVRNFLSICLKSKSPSQFRSILAITFTNKAAQEMKDRIIRALTSFSSYPDSGKEKGMFEDILKELEISDTELKKRSYETLRTVLHQYSAFSVSTIDKFTNRLIRTFAQDLKLSVNYEVELDSNQILGEAIDRMLSNLEEKSPLADLLIRFLNTQLEEGKSPRAELHLLNIGKSLFQEEAIVPISLIQNIKPEEFIKIRLQLFQRNKKIEKQLAEQAKKALDLIDQSGIDYSLFNRAYLPKYLLKVQNGAFALPSNSVQLQIIGEADLYGKGKAKIAGPLIDPIANTLLEYCEVLLKIIIDNYSVYELSKLILSEIFSLGVLAEVERNLQEVKADSNRLPIGEFNKVISDKLNDQPAAFLYERMGDRYQNYFIDEFQDTSKLQWRNMVPLVNNAMGQGGSSMLVGDGKQAIYRWRGGEVEQFLDLNTGTEGSNKIEVDGKEQELYSIHPVSLDSNWRSRRNIVEFNNDFFERIVELKDEKGKGRVENLQHQKLFKDAKQEVKASDEGYVEIKRFPRDRDEPELYESKQNEACLEVIKEALSRGYQLKDIAILNRKKSNSATLSKFLIENNIEVVSPDSLTLNESDEIKVIVAFLRLMLRPDDKEKRLYFLEWLFEHYGDKGTLEHDFLKQWTRSDAEQLFVFLEKTLDGFQLQPFMSLSLTEKVYEVNHILGLKLQENPYLQAFQDLVIDFEVNKGQGDSEFLRYWDHKGFETALDLTDDLNAVRMMTIHKSKGLEFPIVIVAYADWRAFSEQKGMAWIPLPEEEFFGLPAAKISLKQLEELPGTETYQSIYNKNQQDVVLDNLNLLYVALTRPVDELYIFGCDGWEDKQRVTAYLQHYLKSLDVESLEWSRGEKTIRSAPKEPKEYDQLKTYIRSPRREKLAMTIEAPKDWQAGESESTSWGKKVHSILSAIQYTSDAELVIESMSRNGNFKVEEKNRLKALVEEVLTNTELETYFRKEVEVINEGEILIPGAKSLRPDRLVRDGNTFHIIDYKTGVAKEMHKNQVDEYAQIIGEMDFEIGDKVLIYLNDSVTVEKW